MTTQTYAAQRARRPARTAAAAHRSPRTPCDTQPYVFIPDGVIEAYVRDPLAVGIYVAVARLTLIRKGAVALSAGDLAAWMGSTRDHADQVAIMRRILKLVGAGWLCVTRSPGQKHQLLPTWGIDRSGQARPWDFAAVASGRPEHVRGRHVPLALLDITLGQLKPQEGRAPALISRYLSCPLLDLTDIGTYTIRLRTEMAPTPRLAHLGLTGDRLPKARVLLMEAAGGTLTTLRGGETIGVGLTAWGYDQLGIAPPAPEAPEQGSGSISGSKSGSLETCDRMGILPHSDAENPVPTTASAHNTWDVGIMELTNMSSPPNMHVLAGGGRFDQLCDSREDEHGREQPANIPDQLVPQIAASHQTLNRNRVIFPGEWWELLEIQQAHGERQVLIWQARAARTDRAGVQRISPAYYAACAAQAAFENYRPPRYERGPALLTEPPADAPVVVSSAPPTPALARDPAGELLLMEMGIRERELLAAVPLALIRQWAGVIDHAGLAARFDDPHAFAHRQLRKHQPPPPRAELDRWAERARTRAAAAASPPALTDAQVQAIRERHAAIEARAAAIAPDDLTEDERLGLLADLERGMDDTAALERLQARRAVVPAPPPTPEAICTELLERFRQPMHRALWPLLDRVTFAVESETLRIVCERVADLGIVEAQLAMRIRSALRSCAWQPGVRVVAQTPPLAAPTAEPAPPPWIALERWATLPGLLRTMLLGSTLQDGTLRCASPGLTIQMQARYGELVAALLAEAEGEADNAAT